MSTDLSDIETIAIKLYYAYVVETGEIVKLRMWSQMDPLSDRVIADMALVAAKWMKIHPSTRDGWLAVARKAKELCGVPTNT